MRKIILLLLALPMLIWSQTPYLLKDITPGSGSSTFSTFHVLPNNRVLFGVGASSPSVFGLWSTDGTTAGTYRLRSGQGGGWFAYYNSKAYFSTTNAGYALWKTDGTISGTDSIPVSGLNSVSSASVVNNLLFLVANTSGTLSEIWRSDGTSAGTYSLTVPLGSVKTLSVVNNVLYFMATTPANGTEMWRSDGTTSGTYLLKDIFTGTGSAFTFNPIKGVVNNTVFLIANNGITGAELWSTNGTTAGTSLMADIYPGSGSSNISKFFTGNNGVYFMANHPTSGNELWFSDGTSANTQLIRDVATGTAGAIPETFAVVGNAAYYTYYSSSGYLLYKTNGTSVGTTTLAASTVTPAFLSTQYSLANTLHLYNNELYYLHVISHYVAPAYADTVYVFKTDLNLSSRVLVNKTKLDVVLTGGNFFANYPALSTVQGSHFISTYETTGNTNNLVIYNAANNQFKLFYKLGTDPAVCGGMDFQPINNKVYYPSSKNNDSEPAYIDLANDSLYLLKNINPGGTSYACGNGMESCWNHKLYRHNNKSYFFANEPAFGLELFETNYTPAGTMRVLDINAGSGHFYNNNPQNNCTVQKFLVIETPNNLLFGADDGANGFELWTFLTGSPGNTVSITQQEITPEVFLFPNPANKEIRIKSNAQVQAITMFDAVGKLVKEVVISTHAFENTVYIGDLPDGIYFMRIKTNKSTEVRKLVKAQE